MRAVLLARYAMAAPLLAASELWRLAGAYYDEPLTVKSTVEWIGRHAHIVYPALGLAAVLALVLGILVALRSEEHSGVERANAKKEIVFALRRHVGGMTTVQLARIVGFGPLATARLIEEMQSDGLLAARSEGRVTLWRLKGLKG